MTHSSHHHGTDLRHGAGDCAAAHAQLSARLDGELADDGALRAHLAHCGECRAHERALAALARDFGVLRAAEPEPLPDLWPRIARRLRWSAAPPVLLRVAAAVVGFVGLGGTALVLERAPSERAPDRHLIERLVPRASGPDALFAALPEYRLLRALPREESR